MSGRRGYDEHTGLPSKGRKARRSCGSRMSREVSPFSKITTTTTSRHGLKRARMRNISSWTATGRSSVVEKICQTYGVYEVDLS
ncbi:hypothetical protein CH063_14203, partial [Colletotrichum higginsianum]